MKKTIIIVAVLIVLICGCGGQHCIKVGGEYKGITGNVGYCFNAKETANSGVPTFIEKDESEDKGKTIFGFGMDQVEKIKNMLKDKLGIKAVEKHHKQEHPVREILEMIDGK